MCIVQTLNLGALELEIFYLLSLVTSQLFRDLNIWLEELHVIQQTGSRSAHTLPKGGIKERKGPKILISGASLAHHLWAKSMDGIRKGDTHKRRKSLKQQARNYNSSISPQTTKEK